jgi:hypothetical protein
VAALSAEDIGERGLPPLARAARPGGFIGMLMGWWRVVISSVARSRLNGKAQPQAR